MLRTAQLQVLRVNFIDWSSKVEAVKRYIQTTITFNSQSSKTETENLSEEYKYNAFIQQSTFQALDNCFNKQIFIKANDYRAA